MGKVLYVKANSKTPELSRTYKISDSFVDAYKKQNPKDEIIVLDLYNEGINFLPAGDMPNLFVNNESESQSDPILKYTYQFLNADKYIIAAPFWNLSFPAILKAYIDYITVSGITFEYTANGAIGLCQGKKAVNITTRGGVYSQGPAAAYEMGDKYLRILFGFLGIVDFQTIAAEGLDINGIDVDAIVQKAINEAKQLAKTF